MDNEMIEEITVDTLKELINGRKAKDIRQIFDEHNIVDLAEIVEELDLNETIFIFKILKNDITGDLFSYFSSNKQKELVDALSSKEIHDIVNNLYSDDMVDFLTEMPSVIVKKVLSSVGSDEREEINKLLSYADNSAGSIMSTDIVELEENDNVNEAMRKIKQQGKGAETINYCFVLDEHNVLVGIVSLRDILFAPEKEIISELMQKDIISVKTSEDREEVAKLFSKYDFTIVPVLDDSNRLVGVITVDDVIDTFEEEATEDIHKMAGVTPVDGSYLQTNVFKMAKSRLAWLLVLMISYAISSLIISDNDYVLAAVPSLITFTPMLMDTAGNAGSQAAAMVIRGITVDDLTIKDFFKVMFNEFKVGLLCGVVLFIVNTLRIWIFVPNVGLDIALTVSLTVLLVVVFAKMVGGFLPLFALVIKQDPAAMASPLITTAVDSLSLTVYFALAKVLLKI